MQLERGIRFPASFYFLPVAWVLCSGHARADVLELREGGRLAGKLAPTSAEEPAQSISVRGGSIDIPKNRIARLETLSPNQREFQEMAIRAADTPAAQWALAEWCLSRGLIAEREACLLRVIELETDHPEARAALGFSQVNGRWVTPEEWQRGRGYVLYRGRWRPAQQVQLLEERRRREQAESEWMVKLRRWRADLGTQRGPAALRGLLAIRDGYAVTPVSSQFFGEPLPAVRRVYVQVLGNLAREGKPGAIDALLKGTLLEPHVDVRCDCVDLVVELKPANAVPFLVQALGGNDNYQVNRAAYALGALGDRSALDPLIAALVTTHTIALQPPRRGSGDAISTSFVGGDSSGAASAGAYPTTGTAMSTGDGSRVVQRQVANQEVLAALVKLSGGVSFSFDQRAWRLWLAAERRSGGS